MTPKDGSAPFAYFSPHLHLLSISFRPQFLDQVKMIQQSGVHDEKQEVQYHDANGDDGGSDDDEEDND